GQRGKMAALEGTERSGIGDQASRPLLPGLLSKTSTTPMKRSPKQSRICSTVKEL
ncbi:hypothetical protein NDU88_009463, partial [Pleurodeles waltl]